MKIHKYIRMCVNTHVYIYKYKYKDLAFELAKINRKHNLYVKIQ
jgi:hypothetical protein